MSDTQDGGEENVVRMTQEQLERSLHDVAEVEPITVEDIHVLLVAEDTAIAVLETDGEKKQFLLNSPESAVATLAKSGAAAQIHTKIVHQRHLALYDRMGYALQRAVIETVDGDVLYGRLVFENVETHALILEPCPAGETVVFALLAAAPLQVLRRVWEALEDFDHDLEFSGEEDDE